MMTQTYGLIDVLGSLGVGKDYRRFLLSFLAVKCLNVNSLRMLENAKHTTATARHRRINSSFRIKILFHFL